MRVEEALALLKRFPHRGSGSREEAAAAKALADALQGEGWQVSLTSFRAPAATLYEGPLLTLLLLAVEAWLALRVLPSLGAFLALLTLLPLLGELLALPLNFDALTLLWRRSQNVLATAGRPPRLLLVAHLDTQRGTLFFHPALRPHLRLVFAALYVPLFGLPLAILLDAVGLPLAAVLRVGAVVAVAVAVLLLLVRLSGRPVPGANDNASGVAVAARVAEELRRLRPDLPIGLLVTGAEEVGERGMYHFGRTLPEGEPPPVVVNVDNVGGGRLRYLTGEGMLVPFRYDTRLVGLAARLAEEAPERLAPGFRLLLPTDAQWWAARGWPAITFIGQEEDGSIPHYHWYDDTFEKLDERALTERAETVLRFCLALVGEEDGEAEEMR